METQTAHADQPIYVSWLETLGIDDIGKVGGKNASLGELIRTLKDQDVKVPDGFAITVEAYWTFLKADGLIEKVEAHLAAFARGEQSLAKPVVQFAGYFCRLPFHQT